MSVYTQRRAMQRHIHSELPMKEAPLLPREPQAPLGEQHQHVWEGLAGAYQVGGSRAATPGGRHRQINKCPPGKPVSNHTHTIKTGMKTIHVIQSELSKNSTDAGCKKCL